MFPALAGVFSTASTTWEALVLFCEEHKIHKETRVFPPCIKLTRMLINYFPERELCVATLENSWHYLSKHSFLTPCYPAVPLRYKDPKKSCVRVATMPKI